MHYKNGREANNGDTVLFIGAWPKPVSGVLYNATAGNDFCNGSLAPVIGSFTPNLKECYHIDDVKTAIEYWEANGCPAKEEPATDGMV